MAKSGDYLDDLAGELLAWAKAAAESEDADELRLRHVLLGALKLDDGRALLSEILEIDFSVSDHALMDGVFSDELNATLRSLEHPVSERKLRLSPPLRAIVEDLWKRRGGLESRGLLKETVRKLSEEADEEERKLFAGLLLDLHSGLKIGSVVDIGRIDELPASVEKLRHALGARLMGQPQAIEAVCQAFFSARLDLDLKAGPAMLLTFAGPPGVGKTYLAELLARHLSGDGKERAFLRLDMTAYSTHQAHEQLVGFNRVYAGAGRGVLTGFVSDHPDGVILVDEIEKAHPNTQNLFLQILDAGHLHENRRHRKVDFSRTTLIFTTNLGRDLYDAPNRAGFWQDTEILKEALLDAIRKDVRRERQGQGLAPEMVSRMAKGEVVLFQHLDGPALFRIADLTVRDFARALNRSLGLKVELDDTRALLLMVMRFGAEGDARRLTAGLEGYLKSLWRRILECREDFPVEKGIQGLRFEVDSNTGLPESLRREMERPWEVMVIDETGWRAFPERSFRLHYARDRGQADELLRQGGVDFVLLDLHLGETNDSPRREQGLAMLRWLRRHYADLPVLLFSELPERRGLSEAVLLQVASQGGARGILPKDSRAAQGEADEAFVRRLREFAEGLRHESLIRDCRRKLKTVAFDYEMTLDAEQGWITVRLCRTQSLSRVASGDRSDPAWVDLPANRFDDIVGAEPVKERLREIVGWLQDPSRLRRMNLELPKGLLLTGPPGTGKTMLARALAGEAGLPFFALSGGSVFSKWLGESEQRIHDLFERARRYAPAVIFIDEIDSLGRQRDHSPLEGRSVTRESVLNELLAQMDGFAADSERPLFVLAATNRPDILDPALTRPGRFDLQVEIPAPYAAARKRLLEMTLSRIPHEDLDLTDIVVRTTGFSGAAVKQVCKEAALLALRQDRERINQADLHEAVNIVNMGMPLEQRPMPDDVRWSTAVHEMGHALVHTQLRPGEPIAQISILPRGRAMGFMEPLRREGQNLTAKWVKEEIRVLYGGRAAEELILGPDNVTAGCDDDLRRATELAMRYHLHWQMEQDAGSLLHLEIADKFTTQGICDKEWQRIESFLKEQYERTCDLLRRHDTFLRDAARQLLDLETLYGDAVQALFSPLREGDSTRGQN